jgi:hypothetical protein
MDMVSPNWLKRLSATIIFIAAALSISTSRAASTPVTSTPAKYPFFTANYDANIKGIAVTATREFKPINDKLSELSFSATSWMASLTETSQFTWGEQQIKPIRFEYKRNIIGNKKKRSLTFDGPNNRIISYYKDKTKIIPNPSQALDNLSFQLQLQYDLLLNQKELTYHVADKDRIKQYGFEIVGEELINTAIGSLKTIKIKVIRANKKRVTYLWLASNWHNLLTQLEQYENGKKEFELQLTSAVIDGNKVTGI